MDLGDHDDAGHGDSVGQSCLTDVGFGSIDSDSRQRKFRSVKDTYQGVRLSDDLYFSGRNQGLDVKSKDVASVLSSTARYVETTLQITSALQGTVSQLKDEKLQTQADDLLVSQVALMRHLQETRRTHCGRNLRPQGKTSL